MSTNDQLADLSAHNAADLTGLARVWWLWLVVGVAWFIVALVSCSSTMPRSRRSA
jgi:hypothetical protein